MASGKRAILGNVICIAVVMVLAVGVRLPSAWIAGAAPEEREAYTDETGVPYLIDEDSYYHVRIVDGDLARGSLGDSVADDGTPWDSQSFYPEGRSAVYQPGIVKLTEGAWAVSRPLLGASLAQVEFCLAALMSALAGLAAFAVGYRMSGRVGGVLAGVLVACAPAFVLRTTFGRYDTDMFVVLMDVALILTMTEAFRAARMRGRIAFSVAFGLVVGLYAVCWTPQHALLFVAVMLMAGFVFAVGALFACRSALGKGGAASRGDHTATSGLQVWVLCLAASLVAALVVKGPSVFTSVVAAAVRTGAPAASGTLPNLYASIAELVVPRWAPASPVQWFAGYVAGDSMTVLNGLGGIVVVVCAVAGMARLGLMAFERFRRHGALPLGRRECVLYACIVGLLLVGCLYAVGRGVRFIEHLAVPVGLLAGAFAGLVALDIANEQWGAKMLQPLFTVVLCVAVTAPALIGSVQLCAAIRPTVSDSSAAAMRWVKDNAHDPQALVASWWDDEYFYESASGHPCLWDGGSMDGVRGILVGKALTTDDAELSRAIFSMLATSGNRAPEALMRQVDARVAFEAIWAALPLGREQAVDVLVDRCDMPAEQAQEVEALLHPAVAHETYLVLSDSLMNRYGWFEFYANWDFTGNAETPSATRYDRARDGRSLFDLSDGETRAMLDARSREIAWRLFVDGAGVDGFVPVFDEDDGVERVAVWRL